MYLSREAGQNFCSGEYDWWGCAPHPLLGFNDQSQRHMWVYLDVESRPCIQDNFYVYRFSCLEASTQNFLQPENSNGYSNRVKADLVLHTFFHGKFSCTLIS